MRLLRALYTLILLVARPALAQNPESTRAEIIPCSYSCGLLSPRDVRREWTPAPQTSLPVGYWSRRGVDTANVDAHYWPRFALAGAVIVGSGLAYAQFRGCRAASGCIADGGLGFTPALFGVGAIAGGLLGAVTGIAFDIWLTRRRGTASVGH